MAEETTSAGSGDATRGTYGELRRWLKEQGDPWTVDPTISDEEPLPEFPLGALSAEEDAVVAEARVGEDVDVRELVAEFPPNDPGLRRRWADEGLRLDRVGEPMTGDRPDTAYRKSRSSDAEVESRTEPGDGATEGTS